MFAIGSSLKDARLRKGLDLPTAAEATKIRSRHLQALEDEQFDVLPGQTYVRGFLKTYADFLGLDGQLYVDEYSSRFWVNEDGTPATRRKVRYRRKHHGRIEMNMIVAHARRDQRRHRARDRSVEVRRRQLDGEDTGPTAPLVTRRATPDLARLRVKAIKGSSVIDVRVLTKKGRLGRLLYHGTLERGESQSFAERSIWLSISTPRHIMLALNGGTPLALSGLCPRTIAVTPQQITQTVTCH